MRIRTAAKPNPAKRRMPARDATTWDGRRVVVSREHLGDFEQAQRDELRIRAAARTRRVNSGGASEGATVANTPFGVAVKAVKTAAQVIDAGGGVVFRTHLLHEDLKSAALNEAIDHFISPAVERSLGLPLRALIDFDTFIYGQMSTIGRFGELSRLAGGLINDPPTYVFLGSDDPKTPELERDLSCAISAVAAGGRGRSPPQGLPEKYLPVWQRLLQCVDEGRPLVDIVLDGNPADQSPADRMAYETIAEAFSHKTRAALKMRYEKHGFLENEYLPWLKKEKAELAERLEKIYPLLTPDWLSGKTENPSGWKLDRDRVMAAYHFVTELPPAASAQRSADFLDLTHALVDRGLSGTQTFWLKLLRELPPDARSHLLRKVADATGKILLDKEPCGAIQIGDFSYYDRQCCAFELCRESLNGLGYHEREVFARTLAATMSSRTGELEERAKRVAKMVPGSGSPPLKFDRDPARLLETFREPKARARLLELLPRLRFYAEKVRGQHPDEARLLDTHAQALELLALASEQPDRVHLEPGVAEKLSSPVIVGEFAGEGTLPEIKASMLERARPDAQAENIAPKMGISVVLEGGGGKGFAYAELLKQLDAAIAESRASGVRVDEYVGTSAGAVTAALLAAGFGSGEVVELLTKLSFTKFFADYFAMMGGLDPRLRGAGRCGAFSTRTMYETIHRLLSEKLGITDGGPVLFKDLPHNLKVVATVVSTDLPRDLKERLGIAADGRIVFSKDTTPNMDVAAAICASAAVPVFFRPPQVHVCAKNADGALTQYRLQLVDGGVLENLPAAEATRAQDGKSLMVMLPTFTETDPSRGKAVRLSTLDFEPQDRLPAIDAYNRERFTMTGAALPKFLSQAVSQGYRRGAIVFNLTTPKEQRLPIVQGETREETQALNAIASEVKLPTMSEERGRRIFADNQAKAGFLDRLGKHLVESFDRRNIFQSGQEGGKESRYRIPKDELEHFGEVVLSAVSGLLVTKEHPGEKRFESG